MKLISSFLILLVAVAILVVGIAGPRVGATSAGGPAYPRLANVYLGGITDPASLAKWDLIIAQGGSNTSQYAPIKASNPNAKIITYVAAQEPTVQLPSPRADEVAGGFSPLWNLQRADGSLITGFGGNQLYNLAAVAPVVGGERWSDHLAAWIIAHKTGDGIYLDNAWGDVAWKDGALDLDHNGVADVTEHGNAWIDSQWEAGLTNLAAKVRAGLGPDALIVANGAALLRSSNNGRLNEGFDGNYVPSLGGSDWAANFQDYRDWTTTHQGDNASVVLRNGNQTDYPQMRFYLGTALLGDGYFAYANGLSLGYSQLWWYDEYSVDVVTGRATGDASHKGYLGQPKGLAVLNANGTYTRAYAGGIVIVNPTTSTQTQALGGSYRLIKGTQDSGTNSGATVTSVTLASWDARILLAPASVSTSTSTTTPTRIFLPTLTATRVGSPTAVVSTFAMLAGDVHNVTCGNGTIASSVTQGIVTVTCLAPSTATATPTKVLPTATATVTGPRPLALGIRLDRGDSVTLDGWNAHALPMDSEHSQGANTAILLAAKGNDRQVACGGAAVLADSCQAAINYALAAHITDLNVNDEGPDCSQLMIDEATVYQKIHAAGLTQMWAPTGTKLRSCAPNSFTSNTDALMFQFEALQGDPSINVAQVVHAEIAALRNVRPGLRVACQSSVNPAKNRLATAQQTLADIAAVQDGSANQCDRIDIYYTGRSVDTSNPARADVMLEVQKALRP